MCGWCRGGGSYNSCEDTTTDRGGTGNTWDNHGAFLSLVKFLKKSLVPLKEYQIKVSGKIVKKNAAKAE